MTMEEKIIDILKDVEGISISDGLQYCGSGVAYAKFIGSFYGSIEKKASDIEAAYKAGDFALYTIKVHALKSTARIAGFPKLSELALRLEEAGEAGDLSYIRENNSEFLKYYRSFTEKLSVLGNLSNNGSTGKPITEAEMKDAYSSLAEYIAMEDYDAVELILEEIKKYSIPDSDQKNMDTINRLLKDLDWEGLKGLFNK